MKLKIRIKRLSAWILASIISSLTTFGMYRISIFFSSGNLDSIADWSGGFKNNIIILSTLIGVSVLYIITGIITLFSILFITCAVISIGKFIVEIFKNKITKSIDELKEIENKNIIKKGDI